MKRLLLLLIFIMGTLSLTAQTEPTAHCYAEGDDLWLDHYRADVEGKRPCVIFAFGGGFSHGTRKAKMYTPYFEMLLKHGFDVVAIDYRLGMAYTLEEGNDVGIVDGIMAMYRSVNYAAEDLLRATRYLLDNADEWQIDTTRIVASGSSAGAIASLQAENYICNNHEYASSLPKEFNYAGVVAFAGAVYSILGDPNWAKMPCPMMLFHGNSDRNVPYYRATMFGTGFYGSAYIVEQLSKIDGSSIYFYSAIYRDHDMAVEPLSANHKEICDFLQTCVVEGKQWRNIVDITNPAVKPQQTKFTIMEYLNSNYASK